MNIILKQPVKNLGEEHDIVKVKPGYARNYLIPQGMAIPATTSNIKVVEELKRQKSHKQDFLKKQALELAEKLDATTLEIETLAGAEGKLFGSITNIQVANHLKEKGFDIDKRVITVDDVHSVGEYNAMIHLHREVKATVKLIIKRKED